MKKLLIILTFSLAITNISYGETLSLNSYSPSPKGSYDRIRLLPRSTDLTGSCDIGLMYVNTSGQLQFCQDDGSGSGIWGSIPTFWTQSGDNLYPTDTLSNSNLYVGIGTNAPERQLHVAGDGEIRMEDDSVGVWFYNPTSSDEYRIHSWDNNLEFKYDIDSGWDLTLMSISSDGKVGFHTPGGHAPDYTLHVEEDILLATGTYGSGETLAVSGTGTRLIWYPKKAAFRAGYVNSDAWNDTNIGIYSVATGIGSKANGTYSTSMGYYNTASGDKSTAFGKYNTADGCISLASGYESSTSNHFTMAIGRLASATGLNSVSLGYRTDASGTSSLAFGSTTTASGSYSVASGHNSVASGSASTALGYEANATGTDSTALGVSTLAAGNTSTVIGYESRANGDYATALGRGIYVDGDYSLGISLADSAGTIISQANTMAIIGGVVGIGMLNPTEVLHVTGNIYASGTVVDGSSRDLKNNIEYLSITDALNTLENLNPITFYYKEEQTQDLHLGFIAEDVPELVSTPDKKGISAMDITATMTKVVQHQQKTIKKQNILIENNQQQINVLKEKLKQLQGHVE